MLYLSHRYIARYNFYMELEGDFIVQIHGTTMGSPVSVIVANLVMELESKRLRSFIDEPRLFYRFVDDTIAVLKKTRISGFLEH